VRDLGNTPLDTESISRIITLGFRGYASQGADHRLLETALARCGGKAVVTQEKLKAFQAKWPPEATAEFYSWVLGTIELARWKAQTIAIKQIYYRLTTRGYRRNKGRKPERRKRRTTDFRPLDNNRLAS
jgi:hypothetical protein